jgi:two-component system chemotaxis sensor kinase CheA
MSLGGQDANLLNDFLTESGELIERLDADLVRLEHEAASRELLDGIFRALHTIKGAASFLSITSITRFSHAAEDALNRLRKGEAEVDAEVIDTLLKSVDVIKGMLADVGAGQEAPPGPDELFGRLKRISEGAAAPSLAPADHAPPSKPVPAEPADHTRPLALAPDKADLLGGLIAEIECSLEAIAAGRIPEVAAGLVPTAEFFGFPVLIDLAARLTALAEAPAAEAALDAEEHAGALRVFLDALKAGRELIRVPAGHAASRLAGDLIQATPPPASSAAPPDPKNINPPPSADAPAKEHASASGGGRADAAETTVRVEVERLDALLNLVGQLVLTKNQLLGVARQLRGHNLSHDFMQSVTSVTGALGRLTSELQVGVMRTRLQPLNKLFGRYPRVVRDLARATGKQIDLEIVGGDTEVDKSVLEQLADPMVHILRNSADHGIEMPDVRTAAGKPATGCIRVEAMHQGGHVRVVISDNGKGVDPAVIGPKAVEKGVISREQLVSMTSEEIVNLIFAAGFSTAEKVSDLSGRGVGMDVVRTNIAKIGGTVSVSSTKGVGTTIEVLIPLTVAIMPAMLVAVGRHQYALPLACIMEIVRAEPASCHSVAGQPVIRIRKSVLSIIDLSARLGEPPRNQTSEEGRDSGSDRFAVVVEVGQQRAALLVDELVGQQEVVIKPLDDHYTKGGPFSGATIREDGDVSLIIDAPMLVRTALGATAASG